MKHVYFFDSRNYNLNLQKKCESVLKILKKTTRYNDPAIKATCRNHQLITCIATLREPKYHPQYLNKENQQIIPQYRHIKEGSPFKTILRERFSAPIL